MKILTRAALIASAISFAAPAAINPVAAWPETGARALKISDPTDFSARRYHRSYPSAYQPYYYARPYYYRPYPYSTPVPFVFGFNFGPSWR